MANSVPAERSCARDILRIWHEKVTLGEGLGFRAVCRMLQDAHAGRGKETVTTALQELVATGVMVCEQVGTAHVYRIAEDVEGD